MQSADCIISYITRELSPRDLPLGEIPDIRVSLSAWLQAWRAVLSLVDALHTASIRASQSTTSLNQECILSREPLLRKTNEKVFFLNFFLFACGGGA